MDKTGLGLWLGLFEAKSTATFFPFTTFLEQIDTLETLQHVPSGRDFAGTSKAGMLTHDLFSFSKKVRLLYQIPSFFASAILNHAFLRLLLPFPKGKPFSREVSAHLLRKSRTRRLISAPSANQSRHQIRPQVLERLKANLGGSYLQKVRH